MSKGRKESGVSDISSIDELDFWIPEPTFEVSEDTAESKGRKSALGVEEVVYKVFLDFGGLGSWYIYVTRTNLSSLISQVQLNKVMNLAGKRPAAGGRGSQLFNMGESTRVRMGSNSSWTGHRAQLIHQASYRTNLQPRVSNADEDKKGANFVVRMTKLLFNPAVGTTARIKKVREERRKIVGELFTKLLSNDKVRNSKPVKEFLRISNLTFDLRFGKSFKEGWVRVSVYPRSSENERLEWKGKVPCFCCVCACAPDPGRCSRMLESGYRKHRKMWAVVKTSFIAFFSDGPSKADPRLADLVIKFSSFFEIFKGYSSTGSHRTIVCVEDSKKVRLKFSHRSTRKIWSKAIYEAFQASKGSETSMEPAGWSGNHEHYSFAPRRFYSEKIDMEMCTAQWHVDAESYFKAVYHGIKGATSQIFIQGWWVCPDLPLVRPSASSDESKTLFGVLKEKAQEGVKISILMYQEVPIALPLDSQYQLKKFRQLSEFGDVRVLRHPPHQIKANSTWFWSHHEKLVVIDQCHAFCGGIDLSWGRYDNALHRLYDPHEGGSELEFPGIDFSNVRVKDFEEVSNFDRRQHSAECPRMPWHDIHCEWRGAIARDLARHFVHQWNHARFSTNSDYYAMDLIPMDNLPFDHLVGPKNTDAFEIARIKSLLSPQADSERKMSSDELRKENFAKHSADSKEVQDDQQDGLAPDGQRVEGNKEEEEEEEEEEGANGKQDDGTGDEKNDANDPLERVQSQATITESDLDDDIELEEQDNNTAHQAPEEDKKADASEEKEDFPPSQKLVKLSSSSQDKVDDNEKQPQNGAQALEQDEEEEEEEEDDDLEGNIGAFDSAKALAGNLLETERSIGGHVAGFGYPVDAQVVRSLGTWSGASPGEKEQSIQNAMRSVIENSKHFVYIENQFFISGLETDNAVANRVLESLYRRIIRAHESQTPFKVYVVIPLLPGFEGLVSDSTSIRNVLYFQYRSISRGPHSLFHNLLQKGVDPDEYICFFSLRTWQRVGDAKADTILGRSMISSELVYVHSKLLMADDEVCMIGSGNINDRSLMGNRDSELSVVIRNPEGNSEDRNFVKSLRLHLFKEHWGHNEDLEEAIAEPWKTESFTKLRTVASNNTGIFEKHLNVIPRNSIRTLDELKAASTSSFTSVPFTSAVCNALSKVQGHVVMFPLNFLYLWDLKPGTLADPTAAILGNDVFI